MTSDFSCKHQLNLVLQVREQGQQKGEVSPFLQELLRLEDQAKEQGLGRWSKVNISSFAPFCFVIVYIDSMFIIYDFSCLEFFLVITTPWVLGFI